MATSSNISVIERIWPSERPMVRNVLLALFGTALLWASAKVAVPFWPVPMTMQTAVVLLIGMAYGWRLGVATILAYLAEGAIGLPVFTGTPERGIGLAYMAGPTGGYLLGFIAAAAIAGYVTAGRPSLGRIVLGAALGLVAIYALGVGWLATGLGLEKAIAVGAVPFLAGEALKFLLVVVVARGLFRDKRPA